MCNPVDNFDELKQENEDVVGLPRGLGDPDAYGYPGQTNNEGVSNATIKPAETANVPF